MKHDQVTAATARANEPARSTRFTSTKGLQSAAHNVRQEPGTFAHDGPSNRELLSSIW